MPDKKTLWTTFCAEWETFGKEKVFIFAPCNFDMYMTNSMEHQYIQVAVEAALRAGKVILSIYEDPASDFQVEQKADHSPLTVADRKAHEAICACLADTPFPVLSEEGKHLPYAERKQWETLWIVDPLDGTKEFIKRNGEFTVNIALVHHAVPVMGVIYIPVKRELYFALEGEGAYKAASISLREENPWTWDELVAQAGRLPLWEGRDAYVVVASRSHLTPETEDFIEILRQRHGHVQLVSKGSSLKICLVAEGKADIYPRFAPTMEWDTAAGHAIARAAGCEVWHTDFSSPLVYNKEDLHNPWFIVAGCGDKVREQGMDI